ncbi:basic leucine zipper transcriptional factor ATF-like 3 isoform X2 [Sapajus apella]|uniref:Basic leucine zipper transcriptional factor ATF-like 3 isoform X2 n=1 Tax=Sapajus apella TaxID=9515 RepID=A0A6J3IRB3_SAPAP|nr:basic leucine zipper transcriptional factor ATF-like 3 isoform X2 [Sapajus apella]
MPRWDRGKKHGLQNTHCVSQPEFPGSGRRTPKAGWHPPDLQPPWRRLAWSPEDDDRKVRRREKNRVAAQRSRKKQTQKADKLHEEYECLEQENTMLRREIGKLTEELKHLTEALKEHEKMCPLLLCPMNFVPVPPRPDPVAGCLPR